jgi:hypothetical protein
MASTIHTPYRPADCPTESVQNTDPMVFGDAFIYSNCLQDAFVSLRTLAAGSIVLFGRHSRANNEPAFSLDTCLVIDRIEKLAPVPVVANTYGGDLVTDAVLSPLHTEGATDDLTVYFGRGRLQDSSGPFSFFPARAMNEPLPLFPRPRLSPTGPLKDVISPTNMQGINNTPVSVSDRDAIWEEVALQVAQQHCALGYHAAPPPMLDSAAAQSASRGRLTPLSG